MYIRYEKLWRLLEENKMKKKDFAKAIQVSRSTMTRLNGNQPVSMDVMMKICKVFHCDIGDVMEIKEQ